MSIVAPVEAAGSDTASAAFDTSYLSQMRADVPLRSLTPGNTVHADLHYYDPTKLILNTAIDARVYFLNEHAGYHNTMGFNTQGSGVTSGDPKPIFPDMCEQRDLRRHLPGWDHSLERHSPSAG